MKTAVLLLLLIPLFRVSLSSDLQVTKTLIRDHHLGVSFGNFEIHKSHRLLNASVMGVTSKEDQPTHCAFTCIGLPWCLSYNFQKTFRKLLIIIITRLALTSVLGPFAVYLLEFILH